MLHYNLSQRCGRSHKAENKKNLATFVVKCCHDTRLVVMVLRVLLHEYRDLFIDKAVRNNRSKLAIANRHQER